MKHNLQVTIIILSMFIITQFIGLLVVNAYSPIHTQIINETTGEIQNVSIDKLPQGFQPPAEVKPIEFLPMLIISFILAIIIMLILMKFGLNKILKLWFFVVVIIAIGLTLNTILTLFPALNNYLIKDNLTYAFFISLLLAIPLSIYKIYKRNLIVHNITELMVYPGLAAILVPLFNVTAIIVILIIISLYDAWAVWHSGIMQKMTKFQMNELKIFAGFFIPYIGRKQRRELKLIKSKFKTQKSQEKELRKKKMRVSLAILGGGDVVFPIIAAGTLLRIYGWTPAILIIFGALAGLSFLLLISQKKKFYPAMPFITAGIFLAMLIWRLFLF
ncbi:MAG: presenilin family intramembrane aspartyl protease [Nanoarchaeota archaeon]